MNGSIVHTKKTEERSFYTFGGATAKTVPKGHKRKILANFLQ
jgi:hypothetical protein